MMTPSRNPIHVRADAHEAVHEAAVAEQFCSIAVTINKGEHVLRKGDQDEKKIDLTGKVGEVRFRLETDQKKLKAGQKPRLRRPPEDFFRLALVCTFALAFKTLQPFESSPFYTFKDTILSTFDLLMQPELPETFTASPSVAITLKYVVFTLVLPITLLNVLIAILTNAHDAVFKEKALAPLKHRVGVCKQAKVYDPTDFRDQHLQVLCHRPLARSLRHMDTLVRHLPNPALQEVWSLRRQVARTMLFIKGWVHSISTKELDRCYNAVKMLVDGASHDMIQRASQDGHEQPVDLNANCQRVQYIAWDGDLLKHDSFTYLIGRLLRDYGQTNIKFITFKKLSNMHKMMAEHKDVDYGVPVKGYPLHPSVIDLVPELSWEQNIKELVKEHTKLEDEAKEAEDIADEGEEAQQKAKKKRKKVNKIKEEIEKIRKNEKLKDFLTSVKGWKEEQQQCLNQIRDSSSQSKAYTRAHFSKKLAMNSVDKHGFNNGHYQSIVCRDASKRSNDSEGHHTEGRPTSIWDSGTELTKMRSDSASDPQVPIAWFRPLKRKKLTVIGISDIKVRGRKWDELAFCGFKFVKEQMRIDNASVVTVGEGPWLSKELKRVTDNDESKLFPDLLYTRLSVTRTIIDHETGKPKTEKSPIEIE